VYLLSVAARIACKDANLFEAFSCSWTPSSTFYKLLALLLDSRVLCSCVVREA
jgi:hypothetical protein